METFRVSTWDASLSPAGYGVSFSCDLLLGDAQVELQAWRKLNEQTAELTAKPGYFAEEGVEQLIGLLESFYVSDCLWNLTANRNDSGTSAPIQQTTRRVLRGEAVPATEKVVSLFEPHTDVLVKDRRETYYEHKIFLTGGASGLILDCAIVKANPADSTWAVPMLKRQRSLYGRAPRQASFDGDFASKDNLTEAKVLGVSDVCFAKRRGLAVLDMVKSSWVYRKLRAFRAGIESVISLLKRAFGLDRCTWKGGTGFVAYVRMGVLTANLLILARHRLA